MTMNKPGPQDRISASSFQQQSNAFLLYPFTQTLNGTNEAPGIMLPSI
jgi:hypothetical protein